MCWGVALLAGEKAVRGCGAYGYNMASSRVLTAHAGRGSVACLAEGEETNYAEPVMRWNVNVSRQGTEYTEEECCGNDPFCERHGSGVGARYFLVRVAADGSAAAAVHADGVRVRDSWSLGSLSGLQNVLLRMLLTSQVEDRNRGGSDSSWSASSSSSSDTGSVCASGEVCAEEAAHCVGEYSPLLWGAQRPYGAALRAEENSNMAREGQ
jgi:hypothetical protein